MSLFIVGGPVLTVTFALEEPSASTIKVEEVKEETTGSSE
jgi:hypothetical protein